jgi:hypothetical protein
MEDDTLNDSIISFQNFVQVQNNSEQQEVSNSHHWHNGDSSNNEDDNIDMDSESDDEPFEQQLQWLMLWKNPQNAGRKKPRPKHLSSQQKRSSNIPDVDAYNPHTCGMCFLFWPYLFTFDWIWSMVLL